MDPTAGEWVELDQPDGTVRRVWRPDEQPPSPDGTFGTWYVVAEDDAERYEWISAWTWTAVEETPASVVAPAEPPPPEPPRLLSRRFVLGWGAAAAATAVLVVGIGALRGDSARSEPATAAELGREIGISFDRFAIDDQGYLGRFGGLSVTFINQGEKTRTFWATIQAAGTRGVLATETIHVRDLRSGATTTQAAFSADPNLDGLASSTFTVTRIDVTPPPL